jgi:hypothetical protein
VSQLYFLESFSWCGESQLTDSPNWISGNGGLVLNGGRNGTAGWSNTITSVPISPPNGTPIMTAGVCINAGVLGTSSPMITFGSADRANSNCQLCQVGNGQLVVTAFLAGSSTASAFSTFTVVPNIYWRYEFQVQETVVNVAAMGMTPPFYYIRYDYSVYINGDLSSPIMSGTLDTPSVGGSIDVSLGLLNFVSFSPAASGVMSDIYLTDNQLLGDGVCQTDFACAVGSNTDFIPDPTNPNWQNVSENLPGFDSDVTYNYSATPGDVDTFLFTPLIPFNPPSGSTGIGGVQYVVIARKDDAGVCSGSGVVLDGSTTSYFPPTPFPFPEDYYGIGGSFLLSPATNAPWLQTEVNTSEAGYKRNT